MVRLQAAIECPLLALGGPRPAAQLSGAGTQCGSVRVAVWKLRRIAIRYCIVTTLFQIDQSQSGFFNTLMYRHFTRASLLSPTEPANLIFS